MNSRVFTSEAYWSERYAANDIPWDTGGPTTPLKEYIDSLGKHDLKILIPGAGSAWEAEYAWRKGHYNVMILDISNAALEKVKQRMPDFPAQNLIHQDFFEHNGKYDLILEQTFFCALPPESRVKYVNKMIQLLKPGAKLAGVLFDDPLNSDHPPYGGSESEYRDYFFPAFKESKFERCYNSIPPRQGRELFIEFIRPAD